MANDIETIGVAFDTSGLQKGEAAMQRTERASDKLTASAEKLIAAADRQGKAFDRLASRVDDYIAEQTRATQETARSVDAYLRAADAQKKLEEQQRRTADSAEKAAQKQESFFGSFVKAEIVVETVKAMYRGLVDLHDQAIKSAAQLDDFSEITGDTVENLSKLHKQAFISGTSFDVVMASADRLSKGLGKVDDETRGVGKALEYMGIKGRDANGNMRNSADLMREVAVRLQDYEDGAGKVVLVQELFGRGAAQLIPYLNDLAQAGELQANVTAEQAAAAERYEKQQRAVQLAVADFVRVQTLDLLPSLIEGKKAFLEGFKALLDYENGAARATGSSHLLRDAFRSTAIGAAILLESVLGVAKGARALVGSFEAVWADIKLLAQNAGVGTLIANAATGKLQQQLDERNKVVQQANQRYVDLWNYNGTAMSDAVRKAFEKVDKEAIARTAQDLENAFYGERSGGKQVVDYQSSKDKADSEAKKAAAAIKKESEAQQKLLMEAAGLKGDFLETWNRLNVLYEKGKLNLEQLTEAQRKLLAEQPGMKEYANEQKRIAEMIERAGKANSKFIEEQNKKIEKTDEEIIKQKEHNLAIGLSKEAIEKLEAAKLEESAASLERQAALQAEETRDTALYDLYMKQAEKLRELARLKREGADKQVQFEEQKKQIEEYDKAQKSMWESIEKTAHDVWVGIGQGGRDTFTRLRDTLKATLWDLLYQMTVKKWIINIAANVTGNSNILTGGGSGFNLLDLFTGGSSGQGTGGVPPNPYLGGGGFNLGNLNLGGGSGGLLGGGFSQMMGATFQNGLFGGFGQNMANIGTALSGGEFGAALGGAMPYIGIAASLAQGNYGQAAGMAIGSFFGPIGMAIGALVGSLIKTKKGGPKTESGYGYGVRTDLGDPSAAKAQVDYFVGEYKRVVDALGGQLRDLKVGIFSSQDPAGTALTQLQVNAAINGQEIYARGARYGGNLENVGRGEEALKAAMEEEFKRVMLGALQKSGFSDSIGRWLDSIGNVNYVAIDKVSEALERLEKVVAQRRTLEDKYFEMTHTQEEILARNRDRERAAIDPLNRLQLERVYAMEDELKGYAKVTAAALEWKQVVDNVSAQISGYLDRLDATPAGLLTPGQQLANAKSQFEREYAKAQAGDRTALQNVVGYADQYIEAQKAYTASGSDTMALMAYIRTALSALKTNMSSEDYLAKAIGKELSIPIEESAELLKSSIDDFKEKAEASAQLLYNAYISSLPSTNPLSPNYVPPVDTPPSAPTSPRRRFRLIGGYLGGDGGADGDSSDGGVGDAAAAGVGGGGFAVGSNYVPYTGWFKLHEGERVTPKRDNPYAHPYTSDSRSMGQVVAELRTLRQEVLALRIVTAEAGRQTVATQEEIAENTGTMARRATAVNLKAGVALS